MTNKAKGHSYHVRISRQDGQTFGSCTCPAGIRHGQRPMVCKHLAAVIIYLRALREMKRQAEALALGVAYDGNN